MSDYLYKRSARKILYRLSRQYGTQVTFSRILSKTKDFETGEFVYTTEAETVKRGILLPLKMSSLYSYDLTFLAANKNFQYGANYDAGLRYIIIDQRDITFDVGLQEFCYIGSIKYEVLSFEDFAPSIAQIARIRLTQNRE